MSGENLPLVGKLLEHQRHRTTAGYVHLADGHLVEALTREWESGCRNGAELWRRLRAKGFGGSLRVVGE